MHQNRARLAPRAAVAALLAIALALTAVVAPTPAGPLPAGAAEPATGAAAGRWLAEEHRWHTDAFAANPTVGTDALLAWAATGTEHTAAQAVRQALVASATSTLTLEANARVLLALATYGEDPTDVGGDDLDASLRAFLVADGGDAGRFTTSRGGTTPSSNVVVHARAMLALAKTTGGVPATSATALAGTQCGDGSFPTTWAGATCGDLEATALAAQALRAAGSTTDAAEAEAWILSVQGGDGAFTATGGGHAELVGLAAQTLRAAGSTAAADRAAAYVTALQLGPDDGVWDHDEGAIARTAAARAETVDAGEIPLGDRLAEFRSPTLRAVLALGAPAYVALAPPPVSTAPPEPVRWHEGPCAPDEGVNVVVDFTTVTDRVDVRCALGNQISGWAALANAGYPMGSVQGYPGAALCQVDGLPAAGYPTCWYDGYWSYHHAPNTDPGTEWSYSQLGYNNRKPALNSVEGSRYVSLSGENGPPAVGPSFPPTVDCDEVPQAPTFDIVDSDEDLTFTLAGGAVEHAVLTDLTADPSAATFTAGAVVDLTPYEGQKVRIVARRAGGGCAERFDSVYDVRAAYAPRWNAVTGTAGGPSPAIAAASNPAILGWATGHSEYTPGPNVADSWKVPANAYGPVDSSPLVLGDHGTVTLTFGRPIADATGYDLAVFENGFASGTTDFLELGYVEVSSNGADFVRFSSASRRTASVGGFGTQNPAELGGLAGKDLSGRGTPFDLGLLANRPEVRAGTVDLDRITHVRIRDVHPLGDTPSTDSFGRTIHDPTPTTGSGGFDLMGVGVLHQADVTAPVVEITSGPPAVSASHTATIAYTVDDPTATVEYRIDEGAWTASASSPIELVDLYEDAYSVEVRATDGAGLVGSDTIAWSIDVNPPELRATDGPPNPARSRTGTFSFEVAADAAEVECRATAAAEWQLCTSPWTGTVTSDGSHVMTVRAADAVGNRTEATWAWAADTAAPNVSITSSPPAVTPATMATFVYDIEDWTDVTFVDCRIDGGEWAGCQDPIEYTGLAVGSHTFEIRAADRARNEGFATSTWTVRAPLPADEAWVWAAYADFLDREPTSSEVTAAVARLGSGVSRATIARELANREEWLTVIVTRFYLDTLGRPPTPGDVTYWTRQLTSGRRTVATVAASFYGSKECFDRAGGTNRLWVEDLYEALLGRTGSSTDVAWWAARATSKGRGWVALQMFQSLESRRDRVEALYQDLLGRSADREGRDHWAQRLTREGDIALARNLAASPEYLARAQTRFG